MKSFREAGLASITLFLLSIAIIPTPVRVFWGEITDSQCAQVGAHETTSKTLQTSRECTIGCVEAGAKFVLYNSRDRLTFQLDDQLKPRQFAGEKVMVFGTYDRGTNTIHVTVIQPVYIDTASTRAAVLRAKLRGLH